MQEVIIDKNELYSFIKKAVREVLQEKVTRIWLENLPGVSEEEMDDIRESYGKPISSRDVAYSESIDA